MNGYTFPAGDHAALADALRNVTAPDAIDTFKVASLKIVQEWRRSADPVDGLRRAMHDAVAVTRR